MDQLIATLVGAVGPGGALVWYMYYTTTKAIPDIVAAHKTDMAALVQSHRDEMKELVDGFMQELREERTLRETLLRQVIEKAAIACPLHGK